MKIDYFLSQINEQIAELQFGQEPKELYEPIRYLMKLGGKRLRPLLTLLGAHLFSDEAEKALLPAIGVEVFHNFTLMHDDIMDKAPLRRGKATVHEQWNENIAILSGDAMLIEAYELMLEVEDRHLRQVIKTFNQCAVGVCEGQQLDMNFETSYSVNENEYIEMIRLKTAVLLGFALELGGIIADADELQTCLLRDLGENMGIGFQLMDDLLDVYADSQKFGKQVGGDIIANKKTFLLIEALQKAEGDTRQALDYWLGLKDFDKVEKVQAVTSIYNELNIKSITEAKMQGYFEKSFALLHQIKAEETKKNELKSFLLSLMARES
jgi:geranylgeranyl diphosphate synthase, type II